MRKGVLYLFGFCIFWFLSLHLSAQDAVSISGTVKDSTSLQPLRDATISFKNKGGKVLNELTNDKGIFIFAAIPAGVYAVTINFTGYTTYKEDSVKISHASKFFSFILSAADKTLRGVTVTSSKPYITQTIDKITINVEASPIAAGSNAYDVLLSSPGVIEQNNSIQFRGKPVNVLINGRQSNLSGEELKNFLGSMPANGIEKIEILPNPSVKYDAQGGSVINIKLAKNKNVGTNGTITAGLGGGRYGRYNSGLSLNHRNKKINLYGSYDYMHNAQYYANTSNRIVSPMQNITEDEYEVRYRNNHSARLGLDYDIDKRNSIGFLVTGFANYRDRALNNVSVLDYQSSAADSFSTVNTTGFARFASPSVNAYYKTAFDSTGKELTLNANYFNYNKKWDDQFLTKFYDGGGAEYLTPFLLRDNSPANNIVKTFTADYVQPGKNGNWEAGLKTAFSMTDNDVLWEYQDAGSWKTDAGKSNRFIYKENIYAGYINYQRTIKKYSLQAGLRLEHTESTGESVTLNKINERNYTNLFPNIGVQYAQSQNSQFGITYRKSIQRFGFDVVNPFIVYQSQYSYYQGNPGIKPMIMHSVELSHSWKYQLFSSLSYTYVKDAINMVLRQDDLTKLLINSYDNLSSANFYNASLTWTKTFLKGKWTTTNSAGLFYYTYRSASADIQLQNSQASGYISGNNIFRFKKGFTVELSGFYTGPSAYGAFKQKSLYRLNAGVAKEIMKKKGNLKLNLNDIFNSYKIKYDAVYVNLNGSFVNKIESRFANLVFAYKFGNGKVKAARNRKTGIEDEKGRMQ